jgi:hypothetical protein
MFMIASLAMPPMWAFLAFRVIVWKGRRRRLRIALEGKILYPTCRLDVPPLMTVRAEEIVDTASEWTSN